MKINKIVFGLVVAISSVSTTALAQSLEECIARGLENNFQMRIVRNEEQMAHNNASWANAGALPELEASAGYRPSLTQWERTTMTDGNESTERNVKVNTLTAAVTLNWTIFDGFKIQTTHKQLRALERQSEISTRMAVEDLVADITAEYYNCVQQLIRRNNYLTSMALSRERLRIAELNYQTGRFSGLDYQLARSDFHTDSASYVRQKEAVIKSQVRLNQLMANPDLEQALNIADTTILVREDLLLHALWDRTIAANTSLLYAQQNAEIAELDYRKAVSRNYPYLRLNGQYGYNDYHYNKIATSERKNLAASGGLTLGINLFNGNRLREQRNAKLAISNRQFQLEQMKLNLQADLTTCYQTYRTNVELLALQTENLNIARRNYDSALDRYKLGDLSGLDLRQVQKNLLDAEERLLQVKYDAKICEISLLLISGDIAKVF